MMPAAQGCVLQCTAVDQVPPPRHWAPLLDRPEPSWVPCQLADAHGGSHAALLWEVETLGSDPGLTVWWMWDHQRGRRGEFMLRRWCADTDSAGDACGLFLDHPRRHSWQITDPVLEAQRQDLVRQGFLPGP